MLSEMYNNLREITNLLCRESSIHSCLYILTHMYCSPLVFSLQITLLQMEHNFDIVSIRNFCEWVHVYAEVEHCASLSGQTAVNLSPDNHFIH